MGQSRVFGRWSASMPLISPRDRPAERVAPAEAKPGSTHRKSQVSTPAQFNAGQVTHPIGVGSSDDRMGRDSSQQEKPSESDRAHAGCSNLRGSPRRNRLFPVIPMRFQVSKKGGRGGPPPPVMVGTGVPAGPSHVTHLAAHWYYRLKRATSGSGWDTGFRIGPWSHPPCLVFRWVNSVTHSARLLVGECDLFINAPGGSRSCTQTDQGRCD